MKNSLIFLFAFLFLTACENPLGELEQSSENFCAGIDGQYDRFCNSTRLTYTNHWDFSDLSKYSYTSEFLDYDNGKFVLREIDQSHSGSDFSSGTENGVSYNASSQKLILDKDATQSELNSSWTPYWDKMVMYLQMENNGSDTLGKNSVSGSYGDVGFTNDSFKGSYAAQFDGDADHYKVTDIYANGTGRDTGSFSLWFYNSSESISGHKYIFRYVLNGGNDILLGFESGGSAYLQIHGASSNSNASIDNWQAKIPSQKWTHLAGTWNITEENSVKLYINGERAATATQTSIPEGSVFNNFYISYLSTQAILGRLDEIAFWETDLSDSDISQIYHRQKQKYAGSYDSKVLKAGTNASWTELLPATDLPYDKEYTPYSTEKDNYTDQNYNLHDSIIAFWHFNESSWSATSNEVIDASGNLNHGTPGNAAATTRHGKFHRAGEFLGSDNSTIKVGSSSKYIPTANSPLSVSVWVKPESINSQTNTQRIISFHRGDAAGSSLALGVGSNSKVMYYNHANEIYYSSTIDIEIKTWTHVTLTYSGTCFQLYINGTPDGSCRVANLLAGGSFQTFIGGFRESSNLFQGYLDEMGVWGRSLSAAEVIELYRRGANRVKYQVKSCIDENCNCKSYASGGSSTDCDGDGLLNTVDSNDIHKASFIGPGGDSTSSYSEIYNRNVSDYTLSCSTNTLETDSSICWDYEMSFSGSPKATQASYSNTSFASSAELDQLPYFQYRIIMEADDNSACSSSACLPGLSSMNIKPDGRYYAGGPVVKNTEGLSYQELDSLSFEVAGSCNIKYQLSPDGNKYYYFNASSWVEASEENSSYANTSSVLNSKLSSFSNQFKNGSLYFKAFLLSDMSQDCELSKVTVKHGEHSL